MTSLYIVAAAPARRHLADWCSTTSRKIELTNIVHRIVLEDYAYGLLPLGGGSQAPKSFFGFLPSLR